MEAVVQIEVIDTISLQFFYICKFLFGILMMPAGHRLRNLHLYTVCLKGNSQAHGLARQLFGLCLLRSDASICISVCE